jgi:predicted transcriptional regulator
MSGHERALLLSVKPRFAEAILAGAKVAEVRKQRPAVQPGTLVIIYATKPVGAIVGTSRISDVSWGNPEAMWAHYHMQVGIDKDEWDSYLAGTQSAYILLLEEIQRLIPLLTLEQMQAVTSFQPPQSYRYVNRSMLYDLVSGHPKSAALVTMLRE